MSPIAKIVAIAITAVAIIATAALIYRKVRSNPQPGRSPSLEMNTRADEGTKVPPNVGATLHAVVAGKSVALDKATVTVHRAYDYSGPTTIDPLETAKRIAVDATFSGYTDRFKFSDVDVIDGETNDNYGSDPDVAFLDASGGFLSFQGEKIDFSKPVRLLMVFAVPKTTTSIKLGYWGRELTKVAVPLENQGMALPNRE